MIGKFETLESDARFVSKKTNLSEHLQTFPPSLSNYVTRNLFQEYFRQLTNEEVINLYKIFERDFNLFGYRLLHTY